MYPGRSLDERERYIDYLRLSRVSALQSAHKLDADVA